MNLRSVDLNLLVILDALLQEESVSRAARRIGLSQPATSLALQRLRDLLHDPLLVRSGAGMVPTPFATSLKGPLQRILSDVDDVLAGDRFDPQTSRQVFRITATDHAEIVLLPGVMAAFAAEAPGARLVSQSVEALPIESDIGMKGGIDLTLASLAHPPQDFHQQDLFDEDFVTIARFGHPAVRDGRLGLEAFLACRHVLASPRGGGLSGQVDDVLTGLNQARTVVLSVPRVSVIPALVADSDMISTIPRRIAERPEWRGRIELHDTPFDLRGFKMRMTWHPRHHHSAAHRWLRGLVARIASTV